MKRNSGTFTLQTSGYTAFTPNNLPPAPDIDIGEKMYGLLSRADRALGRLDGSIQALPNAELFVFMYVRKEAVLSSQIEGTQASLHDVLDVEAQLLDPKRPNDTEEILNYVRALNFGLKRLSELPLSMRLIREIHEILMNDVRGQHATPGQFRTSQNWIGTAGSGIKDAIFVPPPADKLPELLGELEKYIHAKDSTPLLIRLAMIHAQFETLHPFLDGNGRVGRLLITFLICQQEVLTKPVLYLSFFLKKNKNGYYDRLQAIRTDGNWEDWINFFLHGVTEVANEAAATARIIVEMREVHRSKLVNTLGRGAANGLKLLESMYQRPIFTVAIVAEYLGVSVQAANSLTEKFVQLGLIKEITGNQRYRVYRYDQYVSLFVD